MKGMILAAGVGSRLSPITGVLPKPMVPVANRPVMEHILAMLVRAGVTELKANLHHLPHLVEQHFGDGSRWGARLSYSLESRLLGTAGAVKRVQRFFDDTFVVTVADSVWDLDARAVVDHHRATGAAATVVVKPLPLQAVGRFGVVSVDEQGCIRRFQEKPRPEEAASNLASTGFYVLAPEVLELIPRGEFFDFARDLFPLLIERGLRFQAYPYEGPWSDIGTFAEYAQVHHDILAGAYTGLLLPREQAPGIRCGHHVRIHPEAQLIAPVLIGDGCRIGRGAIVGPGAVLGSHCTIGEEARVTRSVVAAHTYIGRLLELEGCLAQGKWLVKLDLGASAYVEDDTLLAQAHAPASRRRAARALDTTLAALGLAATAPVILGFGLAARLAGERAIERSWCVAPDLRTLSSSGVPGVRSVALLGFNPRGRVGRLAEQLGIGRLPALYNVMRGDIALVGTRPLAEEEAMQVPEEWRSHLHQVPAGFTGLWRLEGEELPLEESLAVDAYYAAIKSTRTDMGILWQQALRRGRQWLPFARANRAPVRWEAEREEPLLGRKSDDRRTAR